MLDGMIPGDEADIACNQCVCVVRTVPAIDLQGTVSDIELTLDLC